MRKPMYSYAKHTKMAFFFTKTEKRRTEQVLSEGLVPMGIGKIWGEGVGG
jgi:hypothetical protein